MSLIAQQELVYYYKSMDEFKDDIYAPEPDQFHDEDIPDAGSDLWEEDNSHKIRQPDFSEVRKKVRNPWKLIVFLIFSAVCWYYFYYYGTQFLLKK